MIGRVTKNPITNCCYAETLAGPTGGTVQKLGLCADCDYEVVLSAGDRDVDGESYVGVSTCCPVTYNPETGVFKVCTLEVGDICGDIDATKITTQCYECAACTYPVPILGCVTCIGDVCSACVYTSANMSFCPACNTLKVNHVEGIATMTCMNRMTACYCTSEKVLPIIPMCTGTFYLNGGTCLYACPYAYSRQAGVAMAACYYPHVSNCCGLYAQKVYAACLYGSESPQVVRLCTPLVSNCQIAACVVSNYGAEWGCWSYCNVAGDCRVCICRQGLLGGTLYNMDDEYCFVDMAAYICVGSMPIVMLCANCWGDSPEDICLNIGPTNGMVYPDDGYEMYDCDSEVYCQNLYVGGRNIIHTNGGCCGCGARCNILFGMDNHLFVCNAEYEEFGWNIVSGIQNCMGTCWQVASCNICANCNSVYGVGNRFYQTCCLIDNVVVGSFNRTSDCSWQCCTNCNVIVGNRNFVCGCDSVTNQDLHVIVGHYNMDCTGCGSVIIGSNNCMCGNRDGIIIGTSSCITGAIPGSVVIGPYACAHSASIVVGCCSCAYGCGAVVIGTCSYANNNGVVAMGLCARAICNGAIAMGLCTCAACNGAVAIGSCARASSVYGLALGACAQAKDVYNTSYSMIHTGVCRGIIDVCISSSITEANLWNALCCMFVDAFGATDQSWFHMSTMVRTYCSGSSGNPGTRRHTVVGEELFITGAQGNAYTNWQCGCPFCWGSFTIRKGCGNSMCCQSGWGGSNSIVYATLHY